MTKSILLADRDEAFIQRQIASGRYSDANHVVRDALRLLEDRESRRMALDVAIGKGLADIDAGRVHAAEDVFDELEAELATLPDERHA